MGVKLGLDSSGRSQMTWVSRKTAGRLAGLLLLVVAALGPWFIDTHPATEETCRPPLVWVGNGYCACFVTLAGALGVAAHLGESALAMLLLCLPALLPLAGTPVLLLSGGRRGWWAVHLAAWGLAGAYALLWFGGLLFLYRVIWVWGAGLCVVVAVATLAGEVVAARRNRRAAVGVFQAL